MLRLLSPSRFRPSSPSSSRSPSRSKSKTKAKLQPRPDGETETEIELRLHLPVYGEILMQVNRLPDGSYSRIGQDVHGELEVIVPRHMGRCRVRYITVGLRTESELVFPAQVQVGAAAARRGEKRLEKDVLFDRRVVIGSVGKTQNQKDKGKGKGKGKAGESAGLEEKEDGNGIVLEEGSQRFAFTLVLPGMIAMHDWHPSGRITHTLYAELGEQPPPRPPTRPSSRPPSRNPSRPASRSASTARQASTPPRPALRSASASASYSTAGGSSSAAVPSYRRPSEAETEASGRSSEDFIGPPTEAIIDTMSIAWDHTDLSLSLPPLRGRKREDDNDARDSLTLSSSPTDGDGAEYSYFPPALACPWLKGSVKAQRKVYIMYNPNPDGGITTLDEYHQLFVEGLGLVKLINKSPIWTVATLLTTTIDIPSPSPSCTIYYIRVNLVQKTSITSPRTGSGLGAHQQDPEIPDYEHAQKFTVWSEGVEPPSQGYTSNNNPALWRGKEAGGKDEGMLKVVQRKRLPHEEILRPSTLPGIVTPIAVSHVLEMAIWYAVQGEDAYGVPTTPSTSPGEVRLLNVTRPVVIPSCSFIPDRVDLPPYDPLLAAASSFDSPAPSPTATPTLTSSTTATSPYSSIPPELSTQSTPPHSPYTLTPQETLFSRSCPDPRHRAEKSMEGQRAQGAPGLCDDSCRAVMRAQLSAISGRDTVFCTCCWSAGEIESVFEGIEKQERDAAAHDHGMGMAFVINGDK